MLTQNQIDLPRECRGIWGLHKEMKKEGEVEIVVRVLLSHAREKIQINLWIHKWIMMD